MAARRSWPKRIARAAILLLLAGIFLGMGIWMKRGWVSTGLLLIAGVLLGAVLSELIPTRDSSALKTEHVSGKDGAKDKILTVRVEGAIVGQKGHGGPMSLLGGDTTSGYDVQEILDKAAKEKSIKAVVVQFSTPGGTLNGAQAIFDGINEYRAATKKPILAHVEDMSASAGVYAMVGADKIYAEPGSLVGSIGVTLGTHQWYEDVTGVSPGLMSGGVTTKAGVHSYTLAAGRGKDLMNPWRAPTEEEKSVLQRQLDTLYEVFVGHVAKTRHIDDETIRSKMGAFIFANDEAFQNHLIDGTMTRREVLQLAARDAGVTGDYDVVLAKSPSSKGLLKKLLSGETQTPTAQASAGHQSMNGVLAIWSPGL